MYQRIASSRSRPPRKEKIYRNSKEDGERGKTGASIDNNFATVSSETSKPSSVRLSDHHKSRSRSRDAASDGFYTKPDKSENHSGYVRPRPDESPYDNSGDSMKNESNTDSNAKRSSVSNPSSSVRDMKERHNDYSHGFTDDSRLSKLVHRALRDEEQERRIPACKSLREFLFLTENWKSISKNAEKLLCVLEEVFHERANGEVKDQIAFCIGTIGYVMTVDSSRYRYFEWIFEKYGTTNRDEARIYLLQALLETLKCDEDKRKLESFIPMLMSNIQSTLENADVPELLTAIVKVILHISCKFPDVFGAHFRDTVDILVGWHIDSTQTEDLTQYTSEALISFHEFWVADISFSLTLLGQFLEDMEAYAEEFSMDGIVPSLPDDEQPTSPSECVAKITSLIKVYTTVVLSLGDYFHPDQNSAITYEFLAENTSRLVKSVASAIATDSPESMLIAANSCICLLLTYLQSHTTPLTCQLVSFVEQQIKLETQTSFLLLSSVIQLMNTIIREVNNQFPVENLNQVFGPTAALPKLRFIPSNQIQIEFLSMYRSVFGLKNVPLLEEAYRLILGDLHSAFETLLGWQLQLPFTGRVFVNSMEAEAVIIFSLSAIAEIANAKNSLIGMWALNPSIFELLSGCLQPTSGVLAQRCPAIHYSILFTLYSHCSRYGNFILSSCLLASSTSKARVDDLTPSASPTPVTKAAPDYPVTSGHFDTILKILAEILCQANSSFDARMLSLKWSQEILESSSPFLKKLANVSSYMMLINAIITSAFSSDRIISQSACSFLIKLLKSSASDLNSIILNRCQEVCIFKMTHTDQNVRVIFTTLMNLISLDIISSWYLEYEKASSLIYHPRLQNHHMPELVTSLANIWQARRHYTSRCPVGTFHSHNFKTVMAFIMQGIKLGEGRLSDMFHICQRSEKITKTEDRIFNLLAVDNECILWFWATWEAARFCVLSKLRTPFGKPQETFTTIEATVKSLLLEAKLVHCDDTAKQDTSNSLKELEFEGPIETHLRAKLLLDFIEHLEKLMYNAYEGCASAMPSAPKAVKTFFRTNKATCLEWLTRIRMAVLLLALHMGNPALAVRQGHQFLQDMKEINATQGSEFEHVVMNVVHALIDLRCPEAILGLYVWCKESIGCKFTWMKAAVEQASRRYEVAASEFTCLIRNYQNSSKYHKKMTKDLKTELNVISQENDKREEEDSCDDLPNDPDLPILTFMSNQVTECYRCLNSWSDLVKWVEAQQHFTQEQNGSVSSLGFGTTVDFSYLNTLSKFESLDPSLMKMDNFRSIDKAEETLQKLMVPFPQRMLQEADSTLMAAALKWNTEDVKKTSCVLSKAIQFAGGPVRVAAMDWPPRIPSEHITLFQTASILQGYLQKDIKKAVYPMSSKIDLDLQTDDCSTWNQVIRWMKFMDSVNAKKDQDSKESNGLLSHLQLTVSHLARKHRNLKLAQKLLLQHIYSCVNLENNDGSTSVNNNLFETVKLMQNLEPTSKILYIQQEAAKLLYSLGHIQQAADVLSNIVFSVTKMQYVESTAEYTSIHEISARSLLTLVKWLQGDTKLHYEPVLKLLYSSLVNEDSDPIVDLCNIRYISTNDGGELESGEEAHFFDTASPNHQCTSSVLVPENEVLFGKLLHRSTVHCASLAKAWATYASWLYKWGRKAVDVASERNVELLPEEWKRIMALLPKDMSDEEITSVTTILSQIFTDADISYLSIECYIDSAETTKHQLLSSCPHLQLAGTVCINGLLDIWRGVVNRIYCFYKLSAEAYFKYLFVNGDPDSDNSELCEDGNITATLRLLRLVVKHASELREVLEEGLAKTPTAPWKGIIPQLFARLNHPETYVRQSISDLLCRVAHAAPHLIVFPAVVGSSAVHGEIKDSSGLLGQYLSQTSDDALDDKGDDASQDGDITLTLSSDEDQQKAAIMRNCFAAMVETLSKQDPRTISEVQMLVHELRRITLLWDELWVGTLNQYHADFSRKISQLENEVKKVNNNSSLSAEEKSLIIRKKHSTILKPTMFVLEQLHHITSEAPETPHEKWFQETFGKLLEDVIQRLKNPVDASQPQASWQLYKQLWHTLQHRAQKRSSLVLSMDQVSPALANLNSTVISMPGAHSKSGQVITIESIDNSISILPTKTKPKKLVFLGCDGHKYIYLFKGLEDLHLDERIMQFISIINNMFAKNKRQGKVIYYARHYSVTPLGPRSGLIQWVEGAIPLFGLYKRWQQREAAAQVLKSQSPANTNSTTLPTGNILRPSEMYYNKLTPLLKEKGITTLDNRKDWPLSVLKQVLIELMDETPKDLLSKELWCSSSSAPEWWKITETYSQSTAVMSMIGYIIGLGDRHLDNVLIDLSSGEIVHIDYNVCFEKGKNLRVPEKVPFRMTPNIETALGVTGIEGIFRISCEHVIKTMRRGRETLLTLLEAFVYDPLIDWTPGGEGGYTGAVYGGGQLMAMDVHQSKLEMEQEITYSMFSIRIAEMKAEWLKNRDELLESLPYLEQLLYSWTELQQKLLDAEEQLQEYHQQMAYLKEAEANANHALYMLHQRYSEYAVVKSTLTSSKEAAQEKLNECDRWHNLHKIALNSVKRNELARWCSEAAKTFDFAAPSFAPVIDFLHTAGQSQLLNQCEQADNELASLLHQHQSLLRTCLDALTTYATIVDQYPSSYLEQNRSFKWQKWLLELLCNFSLSECQEIINKFHCEYGMESMDVNTVQAVITVEFQLQTIITDTNAKLLKLYERLRLEGLENTASLSCATEEARKAVNQFIEDNGDSGLMSFTCVLLTALSSLNKRCLMMEGAAFAAGDRLVDLTSRDGDWFLDEVHSISNNIMEFLLLLKNNYKISDVDLHQAIESVGAVHQVITSLQDLHMNFLTIILPEALKHIQSEEPSVLNALHTLSAIIAETQCPLDTLVAQLEMYVRSIIMEMNPPHSEAVEIVDLLKAKFNSFVKDPSCDNTGLSPGQMLFMGFNGLFTKLEQDFSECLSKIKQLILPTCWKKVDVVKEAKVLLAPVFLEPAHVVIRSIFFLKRVQAMQDFFSLAQQHSRALLSILKGRPDGVPVGSVYNDDHLTRPLKKFIAEFVNKQLLGFPSQCLCYVLCLFVRLCGVDVTAEIELRDVGAEHKVALEELCRKAVDVALKQNSFKPGQLSQASGLASNYDTSWKKQDMARRLEQNILTLKTGLQRVQLQLARHQWLHEDILLQSSMGSLHSLTAPARATVMSEMRKSMQGLLSMEQNVVISQERYLTLASSVEQRLKWAVGANPSVTTILEEFGQSVAARNVLISNLTKVAGEVATTCSTILHFEALRTRTSEAVSSDSGFLQLINRCQESCLLAESCKTSVTPIEEKLIELKPLDGQIVTKEWITDLTNIVTDSTNDLQAKLTEQKLILFSHWDSVKNQVMLIRSALTTHHRLMTDIRAILKSMAKYEEQDSGCLIRGVKQYVQMYKLYSEKFTNVIKEVLVDEFTMEHVRNFLKIVHQLIDETHLIYNDVVEFAVPFTTEISTNVESSTNVPESLDFKEREIDSEKDFSKLKVAVSPKKHLSMCRTELFSGTSPAASQNIGKSSGAVKKTHVMRDPRTGKALQERNSYAVSVWRRVKMKLDGRDPDVSRRSTISEQVDFVIREATNLDNLAVLYEGWTPWV